MRIEGTCQERHTKGTVMSLALQISRMAFSKLSSLPDKTQSNTSQQVTQSNTSQQGLAFPLQLVDELRQGWPLASCHFGHGGHNKTREIDAINVDAKQMQPTSAI